MVGTIKGQNITLWILPKMFNYPILIVKNNELFIKVKHLFKDVSIKNHTLKEITTLYICVWDKLI